MAFSNDVLLKTLQTIRNMGDVSDKSFLMLGKQAIKLDDAFLEILEESDLIRSKSDFGDLEKNDSMQFFKTFGFKEVHALDISDYEQADIIFNLNDELPAGLYEKFDVVFDGGVIEHVFDVAKALMNMCKATKIGGIIISINPIANYLYNVYWNISPQMFIEFYRANKYKILECGAVTFLSETGDIRPWNQRPVIWSPDARLQDMMHPLMYGEHIRSLYNISTNPHPHTFIVARKTNSDEFVMPIPIGYRKKHAGEKEEWIPYTGQCQ